MKGDRIAEPGHKLARFARRGEIDTHPNGEIYITGAAFQWRRLNPDDLGVSVNWLDYFPGDRDAQLDAVRAAIHMSPNAGDRLALLEIGATTAYLLAASQFAIVVLHDPTPPRPPRYSDEDPSHASIAGLPDGNVDPINADVVGDLIADYCVIASVPARVPKPSRGQAP